MLKPILITLSLLGISGCVTTDEPLQPYRPFDLYQSPPAMGELILTDKDKKTSRCQATLVREDYVLTGAHCYANPDIVQAKFVTKHPAHGEISEIVELPNINERIKARDVSVFYQDAAVLLLKNNIYDITPLSIQRTPIEPVDGLHYVSFPQQRGYADSVKNWQACHFDPQEANPKLWLSEDCVLPKGHSGMPLLTYQNDEWVIVGMYHAYLVSRDKVTGEVKKAFGAASPASSWNF